MNSSRVYLDRFAQCAGESVPAGARVLDAGAGEGPYRHHFSHVEYEAADFQQVPGKTYSGNHFVCDLAAIPVEDGRYDLVLFSQVLEHIPEPAAVLAELRRVLKPGGRIWASAPLFYEEHEQPFDFYRYTQFGLRRRFEEAGFEDLEIDWLEGYLGTVSYQLDVAARATDGAGRWRRAAPVLRKLSELAAKGDLRWKITNAGHPKNYTLVARA
ncbi:MAG TPA: class I SAM-dependent methyltransferase [Solirubrobacterales bacterium]|nr:class I SAM-dependent methyltransferase [Solirubrobacterales bacterium]